MNKQNRTRRYVFIDDEQYKRVAKQAIDEGVNYGSVIDEALRHYFERSEQNEQRTTRPVE